MKFKFNLLFLVLFSLTSCFGYAQTAHNTKCMRCKFSKDYIGNNPQPVKGRALDECGCSACNEKNEKERIAKKAEDKKVADKLAERDKKLKEEREKALEELNKKLVKEKEEQKKNEVVISSANSNNNNAIVSNKSISNKPNQVSSNKIMWCNGSSIYNPINKAILYDNTKAKEMKKDIFIDVVYGPRTYNLNNDGSLAFLFPFGYCVVKLARNGYCNGWNKNEWDLLTYDINRVFNNDSIVYIEHFYDDWFVILFNSCETREREYTNYHASVKATDLKMYNVKTKEIINFLNDKPEKYFDLRGTNGLYHNGIGNYVFHNKHYFSSVFDNKDLYSGSVKIIEHQGYEVFFDEITGGKEKWKAMTVVQFNNSKKYVGVFLNGDNKLETIIIDPNLWKLQFSR